MTKTAAEIYVYVYDGVNSRRASILPRTTMSHSYLTRIFPFCGQQFTFVSDARAREIG